MKIIIRGVRGSIPTPGSATEIYGGNTSCVEVTEKDWKLVLDGGSGIQNLNGTTETNRIDILLTHLHLDHIQGLGFFKSFLNPEMEIHIWGPVSNVQSLFARLSRYLSPPLFPVLLRDLPCKLNLHEVGNSSFEIGPFMINSSFVIHPGPTLGFRISSSNSVFTYIPDHEPALSATGLPEEFQWISGIELASGADVLFHDAQYTAEEYKLRIGWGHSAMEDVLKFSSIAGVKHLLLAHHDPSRSDEQIRELDRQLKKNNTYSFQFDFAKESQEIEI